MEDDYLIDCIRHEGDEKDRAGVSPRVSEHNPRLRRIVCKSPEEDRPTFSDVSPIPHGLQEILQRAGRSAENSSVHPSDRRDPPTLARMPLPCITTLRYCTNTKSLLSTSVKGSWRRPLEHKSGARWRGFASYSSRAQSTDTPDLRMSDRLPPLDPAALIRESTQNCKIKDWHPAPRPKFYA
jgi:hypothetical protein